MTLPASGPLSLNDIQTEFGGTNPIGMNEYYAGGGLVPAGTTGTFGAVPSSGALSVQNFYGTSNYIPVYIEELFSTWLYTGGSAQTINNGINLSGNGGLVWNKNRTGGASDHTLFDTARGATKTIKSNTTDAESNNATVSAFTTTGFTTGSLPTRDFVAWTFREQPKFFDIVTYTGDGDNGRTVPHNLGSVPGCIIAKRIDASSDWYGWHRAGGTITSI